MAFDLVIRNGTVVLGDGQCRRLDVGISDGVIAALAASLPTEGAAEIIEADERLVVPGAVDAHYHLGIYRGFAEDAASETRSSLVGGVTSVISYFRTGSHYLNQTGSYGDLLPRVIDAVSGNAYTDFAFHLAPMDQGHIREIPDLIARHGVQSFKYYMFYKGLDLAGNGDASVERMSSVYDLGHLFEIMETVAAESERSSHARISLSIHAEQPELIRLFMERVASAGDLQGLEAYSAARPPLTERLAISEAGVLAAATCAPINLLHLSSEEALDAAVELRATRPQLDVRLETTLHHLALSYETYSDQRGKVNPPIRAESDREALWAGVRSGAIDWVCSDHACCSETHKEGDMWAALPGFGGSALMYPYMLTEGLARGISPGRIVDLVAGNPARAYGLWPSKGVLSIGADADVAVIDTTTRHAVDARRLQSAQEYTPFHGLELTGWPEVTLVRGRVAMRDGDAIGPPNGRYLREVKAPATA